MSHRVLCARLCQAGPTQHPTPATARLRVKGEQLISDINIVNNGGECAQQVAA